MQAITYALHGRVRPVALLLAVAAALGALFAGSAAASTAYSAASAKPHPIPWTGWNGRPIERPHKPVDLASRASASYPAGWRAGAVRFGTGYHRPDGSRRVREVQQRLTRLGYHTGPVDGLYGPLTRSAVQWFQIKHGLRPTGVVAATTLVALRDPKALTQPGKAQAKQPRVPTSPQPQGAPSGRPAPVTAKPASDSTPAWLVPGLIAVLAALLLLAGFTLVRRGRRARRHEPRKPPPVVGTTRPGQPPAEARVLGYEAPVLGYVRTDDVLGAAPHEAAIMEACSRHGWTLARLVRDGHAGKGKPLGRPGLAYALEQLAEGRASRLVVHELKHLARSMAELRMVLGWFMRTGIALTALDVGLDTGTKEGRTAVRALLSVTRSGEAQPAARVRSELASTRGRPPADT
jgi:peptidoglycan hydrolase-like protein with peptidoglycan-binding domain